MMVAVYICVGLIVGVLIGYWTGYDLGRWREYERTWFGEE